MSYELKPRMSGDGFWILGTAAEALGARKLVYLDSSGTWSLADIDVLTEMPVIGVTQHAFSSGKKGIIFLWGFIGDASWSWTLGTPIYASSTAGELTQTKTDDPARIQSVGIPWDSTMLYFAPTLNVEVYLHWKVTETNWDDLRVGATSTKVPTTNPAEFGQVGTTTLYLPEFEDAKDDQLYFETQVPHTYKRGTELRMHLHWIDPTGDTGRVNWKVYYQIKNFDEAFVMNSSSNSGTDMYDNGVNVAGRHLFTPNHVISGTGLKESACIFGRIVREHSAGGDTFSGSVFLLSLDLHYQKDKAGTHPEIPL